MIQSCTSNVLNGMVYESILVIFQRVCLHFTLKELSVVHNAIL